MTKYSLTNIVTLLVLAALITGCGGSGGSSGYTVPHATITVDGNTDDWPENKAVAADPSGDPAIGAGGGDIIAIYLAQDDNSIYIRIDLANGPPSDGMTYILSFAPSTERGPGIVSARIEPSRRSCELYRLTQGGDNPINDQCRYSASGNVVEIAIPREVFNGPSTLFLSATSSNASLDIIDYVAEDGVPINL